MNECQVSSSAQDTLYSHIYICLSVNVFESRARFQTLSTSLPAYTLLWKPLGTLETYVCFEMCLLKWSAQDATAALPGHPEHTWGAVHSPGTQSLCVPGTSGSWFPQIC